MGPSFTSDDSHRRYTEESAFRLTRSVTRRFTWDGACQDHTFGGASCLSERARTRAGELPVTSTRDEGEDDAPADVTGSSRLVAAARGIGTWARQSSLYRWLTKEPEPEVVVIDLRETYTVGPFIALLDRATARFVPWWRESGCRRLCVWTAARLVERPVRALGVVLMTAAAARLVAAAASDDPAARTLVVSLALFGAGAVTTRSRHSWQDIRDTRGYRALAAALEPPEPPEKQERSSDEPVDSERETETDADR